METDPAEAVYRVVRTIPRGRVATYGQVADLVQGVSLTARQVGGAMAMAPPDVPWQRVVGAGGRLPIGKRSPHMKARQRALLEAEGVIFLPDDCVDMARCRWPADEDQGALFET